MHQRPDGGGPAMLLGQGGQWNAEESGLHINILELMGANFAVRTFCKNENNIHVHLMMDNIPALSYISKMGGTKNVTLFKIAKDLRDFCLPKEILLTGEYLPSFLNKRSDWESRNHNSSSEWRLNPAVFTQLQKLMGPMDVDLFASRVKFQLSQYVSWRPDPGAWKTNALHLSWKKMKDYAFPPFVMIARVLAKVHRDKATLVLITPLWQAQPWFPTLLQLSIATPVLLPQSSGL